MPCGPGRLVRCSSTPLARSIEAKVRSLSPAESAQGSVALVSQRVDCAVILGAHPLHGQDSGRAPGSVSPTDPRQRAAAAAPGRHEPGRAHEALCPKFATQHALLAALRSAARAAPRPAPPRCSCAARPWRASTGSVRRSRSSSRYSASTRACSARSRSCPAQARARRRSRAPAGRGSCARAAGSENARNVLNSSRRPCGDQLRRARPRGR